MTLCFIIYIIVKFVHNFIKTVKQTQRYKNMSFKNNNITSIKNLCAVTLMLKTSYKDSIHVSQFIKHNFWKNLLKT